MGDLKDILKKLDKLGVDYDSAESLEPVESFSSGVWLIDKVLGLGGYPRGRLIEMFGPEMSGKSYLSMLAIKSMQKLGGRCALIDLEHGFDPNWAAKIGVSLHKNELLLLRPDYGEQALDAVVELAEDCPLIVVDSTAALVPKVELEGSIEDQHPMLLARMMSQALRKTVSILHEHKATVIFINQLREVVSMGGPMSYGADKTTTPGGKALKFYSSVRLSVERSSLLKNDAKEVIGHDMNITIRKNKCGNPYGKLSIPFYYGTGIDEREGILYYGIDKGVIKQSGRKYEFGEGTWMSFDEMKQGIDLEAVKAAIP